MITSIRQVFYVSAAEGAMSPDAVNRILHTSRRNNGKADITGCLLFSGRLFAQVLEGRAPAVEELTTRIAQDPRHSQVRVVTTRDVQRRTYASWSMAYLYSLDLEDELRALLTGNCDPEQANHLLKRMQPDALAGALS